MRYKDWPAANSLWGSWPLLRGHTPALQSPWAALAHHTAAATALAGIDVAAARSVPAADLGSFRGSLVPVEGLCPIGLVASQPDRCTRLRQSHRDGASERVTEVALAQEAPLEAV